MKNQSPKSSSVLLALLIIGSILLFIPQKTHAALFGSQESIYKIQDTNIKNDKGQALDLAHKVSSLYIFAGVFVHDDGYVLQIRDDSSHYYDLTAAKISSYQAEGLLPKPLPSYSVPFWDYLLGYSLWIILAVLLVTKIWSSIRKLQNRSVSSAVPPLPAQSPPAVGFSNASPPVAPMINPPGSLASAGPAPPKASKLPWVLGAGCLTLLMIAFAIGGLALYRYQSSKNNITVTRKDVLPSDKSVTPNSSNASEATASQAPAGWKTYVSTSDKLRPDLQPHFVAFSFSYPTSFVARPQVEGIFIVVEKLGANGKDLAASFTVSWYETLATDGNKEDYQLLKDLGKQWPQQHPQFNCQEISTFTVNGMNSFGMTWEFTTRDRKPLFVSGAKSILIRPPGKLQGVRIDQYGTWVDPGLKSAGDVGTNDDLAAILRTFRFL